jgi:spermidine/putrescine-binding protein
VSQPHRTRQLPPISRRTMLRGMAVGGAAVGLGAVAAACGGSAATAVPATQPPATAGGTTPAPSVEATPAPATPVPSPEGELYIYNWADYIGEETIKKFEDQTGIKVKYDFYDNEDTMLAKVGNGSSGYDVTFPSSIKIPGMVERGLIQPLDHSLIPNVANLAAEWQDPAYDAGNAHSVPYMWWTTGIAYDSEKVTEPVTSWKALWDPKYSGKMAMLDDYREAFSAALIQLGYDINTTDDKQLDEALALLQQQKPLLRTYTTDDIGVLSSGDVEVMHAWSGDVYQVTPDRPSVKYVIPEEGAVRGSDTMVMLADAPHPIAAQAFINFMLDAQVAADNTNYIGYMGPNEAAKQYIDPAILADPTVNPDKATIAKLQEIQDLGSDEVKFSERWTKLRAGA